MSQQSESPFRDPVLGAEWFRRDLLRDRRDDLAEMPPAIREVIVARCGRLGAGLGAILFGGVMIVVALMARKTGVVPAAVRSLFPGDEPAVIATFLFGAWLAAACGALFGRLLGERAFRREMARCVMPTANPLADVTRLESESPAEAGVRLALRVEGAAAAAGAVGLAMTLPPLVLVGVAAIAARGYPRLDPLELEVSRWSLTLAVAAAASLLTALWMRVGLRQWSTALLGRRALAFALLAFAGAILGFTDEWPFFLTLALGPAAVALMLLRVRRERIHLGLAGSDIAALDAPFLALAHRVATPFARAARRLRGFVVRRVLPVLGRDPRRVLALSLLAATGVALGFAFARATVSAPPPPLAAPAIAITAPAASTPEPTVAEPTAAAGCVCPRAQRPASTVQTR